MKIRSDIHAGTTALEACQAERDYWKAKATYMEQIAKGPGYSPQPPYYPPFRARVCRRERYLRVPPIPNASFEGASPPAAAGMWEASTTRTRAVFAVSRSRNKRRLEHKL